MTTVPSSAAVIEVGSQIGPYRIVGVLGAGGMGTVYRANQVHLNRLVALKVMKPSLAMDKDFCDRFMREARSGAALDHPHVVRILDADIREGILYLAFEFMPGGDLAHLLEQRGPQTAAEALRLIAECADGLHAIHLKGLLHRDIKPQNIFLDAEGHIKLGDLGLARLATGDDRMTMTGAVMGTPAYMAPEQADGTELDIRSDIHALGGTLYTLLTGRQPFTGPTQMAIMGKVMYEPPPDPRAVIPTVPDDVAAVVKRAMAKRRDDRFATPADMRQEVLRVAAGLPSAPIQPAAIPTSSVLNPTPATAAPTSSQLAPTLVTQVAGESPTWSPAPMPSAPTEHPSALRADIPPAMAQKPDLPRPATLHPLVPPRRTAKGAPVIVAAVIVGSALAAGGWWWHRQTMLNSGRDEELARIADLPDGATEADEHLVSQTVATYDETVAGKRKEVVDAAWSQKVAAILNLRLKQEKDAKALADQAAKDAAKALADQQAKDAAATALADQQAKDAAAKALADQQAKDAAAKTLADQQAKDAVAKALADQQVRDATAKALADQQARDATAKALADQQAKDAPIKAPTDQPQAIAPKALTNQQPSPDQQPSASWASAQGRDQCGNWADLTVLGVTQRFRYIPDGKFMMGSPPNQAGRDADENAHPVTLTRSFWMADSTCTQDFWQAVMKANPSHFIGDPQRPVEQVSWNDCQSFLSEINQRTPHLFARLPSEAEWEYACRSGTVTAIPAATDLDAIAWYEDNAGHTTHAVKQKAANPWGLYDMIGDVWQWCGDWYGDYPADETPVRPMHVIAPVHRLPPDPLIDPVGAASGSDRVYRGGGWDSSPADCRSADRRHGVPDGRPPVVPGAFAPGARDDLGFRICVTDEQSAISSLRSHLLALDQPRPPADRAAADLQEYIIRMDGPDANAQRWQAKLARIAADRQSTACLDGAGQLAIKDREAAELAEEDLITLIGPDAALATERRRRVADHRALEQRLRAVLAPLNGDSNAIDHSSAGLVALGAALKTWKTAIGQDAQAEAWRKRLDLERGPVAPGEMNRP